MDDERMIFVRGHQRVKRGQVYFYDTSPMRDKNQVHTITINDKTYTDYVEKGRRPWLVVSSDMVSRNNRLCTIVPLSTGSAANGQTYSTHVRFRFIGAITEIMCEQLRTVNAIELQDYISTVDDSIMQEVEDALAYYLDIREESRSVRQVGAALDDRVLGVIREKLEETLSEKAAQGVIDGLLESAVFTFK